MTQAARALPNWPRLMSIELASGYCGVSATYLRENGPKPKELGRRRLYDIRDLDRWADAIAGLPLDKPEREREGKDMASRIRDRVAHGKKRNPVHLRKPEKAQVGVA